MFTVEKITVGKMHTNCYLLADENGRGVCIDPGDHADRLLDVARQKGIRIEAIWLTHGHFDHLLAAGELKRATQAALYIHEADEACLTDPSRNLLSYFTVNVPLSLKADKTFREGDILQAGDLSFTVWETPGHTPGSCCFVNEALGIVFSGDTLFDNGGIGRTDMPGGDEAALQHSLERLKILTSAPRVYPGHGEEFVLGGEL